MNQEQSTITSCLFARHGATEFNLLPKSEKTKENFKINQKYLDCPVSEKGKLQLQGLAEKLQNLNIAVCFCSPLLRCLESIALALENHPNKNEIVVYVEPNLTEFISGSQHNVSTNIYEKKKIYNYNHLSGLKYDWSFFDSFVEGTEFKDVHSCYFLNFIDNRVDNFQEMKEMLKDNINPDNLTSFLINHSSKSLSKPESYTSLLKRCQRFKMNVKEFLKTSPPKGKIFIMTHSAIIKVSSSKHLDTMTELSGYPEDAFFPKHTETIEIDL